MRGRETVLSQGTRENAGIPSTLRTGGQTEAAAASDLGAPPKLPLGGESRGITPRPRGPHVTHMKGEVLACLLLLVMYYIFPIFCFLYGTLFSFKNILVIMVILVVVSARLQGSHNRALRGSRSPGRRSVQSRSPVRKRYVG